MAAAVVTVEELITQFWNARMSIRDRMLARLEAAWARTAGPTDQDETAWLAVALPLILGAQKAMVALTEAHQARVLTEILGAPIRPVGVNSDDFTGRAVRGVDPREVYARSIISIRRALSQARPYAEGYEGGLGRALVAADTDLALVHRNVSEVVILQPELYERHGHKLKGVRRTLSPPSCGICTADAGAIYPSGKKMRLHPRCDCTATPVTEQADPGAAINAGRQTPAVPVAEHEHGELGPILTDARYEFRELGDLKASPREGQGASREGARTP